MKKVFRQPPPPPPPAELLDVNDMGAVLRCSPRTVYRQADAGRIPPPLKLGALVRWRREVVNDWLAAGCPPIRQVKGGRR
jgi:predicted DNA-binding transcriptional regulator AlpA